MDPVDVKKKQNNRFNLKNNQAHPNADPETTLCQLWTRD